MYIYITCIICACVCVCVYVCVCGMYIYIYLIYIDTYMNIYMNKHKYLHIHISINSLHVHIYIIYIYQHLVVAFAPFAKILVLSHNILDALERQRRILRENGRLPTNEYVYIRKYISSLATTKCVSTSMYMGWLRLVRSLKLQVSFAEYRLFCRALKKKETYNFKEPTNRSHPIGIYIRKCLWMYLYMYMFMCMQRRSLDKTETSANKRPSCHGAEQFFVLLLIWGGFG